MSNDKRACQTYGLHPTRLRPHETGLGVKSEQCSCSHPALGDPRVWGGEVSAAFDRVAFTDSMMTCVTHPTWAKLEARGLFQNYSDGKVSGRLLAD